MAADPWDARGDNSFQGPRPGRPYTIGRLEERRVEHVALASQRRDVRWDLESPSWDRAVLVAP